MAKSGKELGKPVGKPEIEMVNSKLDAGGIPVRIRQKNNRLYLRATLPAKPGSGKTGKYQQDISVPDLPFYATEKGLKLAEKEAKRLGAAILCEEFDWSRYLRGAAVNREMLVRDWVEITKEKFLMEKKGRNGKVGSTPQRLNTWFENYEKPMRRLEMDAPLSDGLLLRWIQSFPQSSFERTKSIIAAKLLAEVAEIPLEIPASLAGTWRRTEVNERDIPSDEAIELWFEKIPNRGWQLAYGLLAAYGLRPAEYQLVDWERSDLKIGKLWIYGSKTYEWRLCYPCHPRWWQDWQLWLAATAKMPKDKRTAQAFRRYDIPFAPYDLRHAWAIRTLGFGWDTVKAAKQMGHSHDEHCRTYLRWISERDMDETYHRLLSKNSSQFDSLK